MEKIKKGTKKGYKKGDNKLKLLHFLKVSEPLTYNAIIKHGTQNDKGRS